MEIQSHKGKESLTEAEKFFFFSSSIFLLFPVWVLVFYLSFIILTNFRCRCDLGLNSLETHWRMKTTFTPIHLGQKMQQRTIYKKD